MTATSHARVSRGQTLLRCAGLVSILTLAVLLNLRLFWGRGRSDGVAVRDDGRAVANEIGSGSEEEEEWSYVNSRQKRISSLHPERPVAPIPKPKGGDEGVTGVPASQNGDAGNAINGTKHVTASPLTRDKPTHECIHVDADGSHSSWTDSHVPRNGSSSDRDVRISFRLHDRSEVERPHRFLSVQGYVCFYASNTPLASSMSGRAILNFTTTVSTDLNIMFIGDSVVQQFAQGFYETVLGNDHVKSHTITRAFINGADIKMTNSGLHVCSSLVAPARGGGASAYWRVLSLMSKTTESKAYVNCKRDREWVAQHGKRISMHGYDFPREGPGELARMRTSANNGATTYYETRHNGTQEMYKVGQFDACVLRVPHGWMTLDEITRERISEQVELCKVVGARTAIVSTLPLSNNVLTPQDWDRVIEINEIIRDVARNWEPREDGVRWVMVMEFGNFTNQILWHNAKHIGYNITMPDFTKDDGWERNGSDFLLHRYQGISKSVFKMAPSIPMVCAHHIEQPFSTKNETAGPCFFNQISRDGMHWCVETLEARYAASVACLLGCVYNGGGEPEKVEGLRRCERECNDRFMSLTPVEEGWIGTNATLYSKSPTSRR